MTQSIRHLSQISLSLLLFQMIAFSAPALSDEPESCGITYRAFYSGAGRRICRTCETFRSPRGISVIERALNVPSHCLELIDVHSPQGRATLEQMEAADPATARITELPTLLSFDESGNPLGELRGYTLGALRDWRQQVEAFAALRAMNDARDETGALLNAAVEPDCEITPASPSPEREPAQLPSPPHVRLESAEPLAIAATCPDTRPAPAPLGCFSDADTLRSRAQSALDGFELQTLACTRVESLHSDLSRNLSELPALQRRRFREIEPDAESRAAGGWQRQALAPQGDLALLGLAEALSEGAAANRIHDQIESMRETVGTQPGAFDPALALSVAYRESGGNALTSSRGGPDHNIDLFSQSGMESLGNLFLELRQSGRLDDYLPQRYTSRWQTLATMSPSALSRELRQKFPEVESPCAGTDSSAVQLLFDSGYRCNEGLSSFFPTVTVPAEHLVAGAGALLRRSREFFESRARELGFENELTDLSPRAMRYWTQLFFGKPGRTSWGGRSAHVGGHAFMQRLRQLQAEGRIPDGVNPLEFAMSWPEFLNFATGRRAWVTAQEAELVENFLLGNCGT